MKHCIWHEDADAFEFKNLFNTVFHWHRISGQRELHLVPAQFDKPLDCIELITLMESIPENANKLVMKNCHTYFADFKAHKIVSVFKSIPSSVAEIEVTNCGIFKKCHGNEQTEIVNALYKTNQQRKVTLFNNGESDYVAALFPMLTLKREKGLPIEIIYQILWYLRGNNSTKERSTIDGILSVKNWIYNFWSNNKKLVRDRYQSYGGNLARSARLVNHKEPLANLLVWQNKHNDRAAERTLQALGLS